MPPLMAAPAWWKAFRTRGSIRNAANVGFGRAVNQAAAVAKSPLLLLINPDCRLMPGAISTLRSVLDTEASCAVVGPGILDPDGKVQGSARGDPDMLTGLFGRTGALRVLLPFLPVARRNVVVEDAVRTGASSIVVDWLSGACMLVRRDAFMETGGFDERFFLYWEDADLCRRLRARGHHVRYVPGASAVHQSRSIESDRAAVVHSRISCERVSVLRHARRPRRPESATAPREGVARCALLVAAAC